MAVSLLGRDRLRLGAAVLVLALVALGVLQYRWLREVAEAQRGRIRADAASRATAIAQDFDREITHAFLMLPLDAATAASGDASAYAARYAEFRRVARWPNLVRGVFLHAPGQAELRRFSPEDRKLVAAEWPEQLEPIRERLGKKAEIGPLPTVLPEVPALVAPVTVGIVAAEPGAELGKLPAVLNHMVIRRAHAAAPGPCTILELDRDVLIGQVLPRIVGERLTTDGAGEFDASVVDTRSGAVLYGTGPPGAGDAGADLLRVRLEELDSAVLRSLAPGLMPKLGSERLSVRLVETIAGTGVAAPTGPWHLVLRHKLGSVERAVDAALFRNLAVAFSVLGVLGASVVLIAASARRARSLAERQLEFVAAVSHELRTPLAVIRSAGENLADGVVADPPQVKRYGGLVRDEGLRLSEMVEQVLSFAGADARSKQREAVDLTAVVERVSRSAGEGSPVETAFAPGAPRALGDAAALERAVANLLANARKYAPGAAIGVSVEPRRAGRPEVAVVVWDRGPGIDAGDRERLFEPFFRGRNAREAQIPGSGLGLAVVRRIAESAGGRLEVESAPGQGARFTLILEAAPAALEPAPDVQAHPAR